MAKTAKHAAPQAVKITAIPVADAAKALSTAYGQRVTEAQVRQVAEGARLVREDGTINLREYTAHLVREMAHGSD